MATEYTYHLAKHSEVKAAYGHRLDCPSCGRRRCFVPYVDASGEPITTEVGKCDHINSCGYHYTPAQYFRDHRDGVQRKERAEFRSYASYEESFNDYVDFLHRNGRYSRALQRTDNGDTFFRELQAAGYATDPRYASKVSQIARKLIGQNIAAASQAPDNQGRV